MSVKDQSIGQTLLLVDDEPTNIHILGETLREQYRLVVAKNGVQALERAQASLRPDLILLDIQMPGMNGYEVCKRLKEQKSLGTIPVIFITALNSAEEETLGLELGAVDYITKPFNPSVVKARVRTHLELQLHRENLQRLVDENTRDLQRTQKELVTRLAWIANELISVSAAVDYLSNLCDACPNQEIRSVHESLKEAVNRLLKRAGLLMNTSDEKDVSWGTQLDITLFENFVGRLRPLLEQHSFSSQDVMTSAVSFLTVIPFQNLVRTLEEQIGRFEYPAATLTLDQLIDCLELSKLTDGEP